MDVYDQGLDRNIFIAYCFSVIPRLKKRKKEYCGMDDRRKERGGGRGDGTSAE